jgi:hypothetical protein
VPPEDEPPLEVEPLPPDEAPPQAASASAATHAARVSFTVCMVLTRMGPPGGSGNGKADTGLCPGKSQTIPAETGVPGNPRLTQAANWLQGGGGRLALTR